MFPHLHIPHPWVFPAVWVPVRALQFLGVGRLLLSTSACTNSGRVGGHVLTRGTGSPSSDASEVITYFLINLALGDEWNRVLFLEHKIGLGLFFSTAHLAALTRCYFCYRRFAKEAGDVRVWHGNAFIGTSVVWAVGGVVMNWGQWVKMTRQKRKRRKERREREKAFKEGGWGGWGGWGGEGG